MPIDVSSALAEKFKNNRQALEAAVLGRGAQGGIDPYSALRALQKLNIADKYEMMQKAMQGQVQPPSIAQQTVNQAQQAPAGLAGMPVPESATPMAGGGIVAFAEGGDYEDAEVGDDAAAYIDPYSAQVNELYKRNVAASGANQFYDQAGKSIEERESERTAGLGQARGLALLKAAGAMTQGQNLARGLSAAAEAFSDSYGKALSADAAEKRSLAEMRLQLADSKRKEDLGHRKDAQASASAAARAKLEADKMNALKQRYAEQAALEQKKLEAQSAYHNRMASAAEGRTAAAQAKAAAGKTTPYQMQYVDAYYEDFKNTEPKRKGETDKAYDARIRAMAVNKAQTAAPEITQEGTSDRAFVGNLMEAVDDEVVGKSKRWIELQKQYGKDAKRVLLNEIAAEMRQAAAAARGTGTPAATGAPGAVTNPYANPGALPPDFDIR